MTDFEKLVLELRTAQKKFFKTHDNGVLNRARELEKQVDKCLDELLNGPDLFKESDLK